MKINQIDWGKVPVDPDPNFSAERNQRIIKETIEENERLRKRRQREFGSKVKEKSNAIARYMKDLVNSKTSSNVEKYFGKKELARLRGEEIRNIIRAKLSNATIEKARKKAKLQTPNV